MSRGLLLMVIGAAAAGAAAALEWPPSASMDDQVTVEFVFRIAGGAILGALIERLLRRFSKR